MAFLSGLISSRSWPRLDLRFFVRFIVTFSILLLLIFLGKDLFPTVLPQNVVTLQVPAVSTTQVLVVKSPIQAGQRLSPEMFTIEQRQVSGVNSNAIQSISETEGKYAFVNMEAGIVVVKDYMTTFRPQDDMRAQYQGRVSFGGQEFVMRGGRMILSQKDKAAENDKSNPQ